MSLLQSIPQAITAIGGLGTAAFGLVDATKSFWGGANRIGFQRIAQAVTALTPGTPSAGLTQSKIIDNLRSNWYNGTDLASQKAIAKSLIKQGLTSANAAALANVVGVDPGILQSVATKISSGTALAANETDVFSRLDFILTALLDDAYQDASQSYTNGTRLLASFFAILLAFVAGWTLHGGNLLGYADPKGQWIAGYLNSQDQWLAILVGILATPLAPIAKDLSSALSTAVNTLQSVKK